jgi:hypothetical protein
MPKTPDSDDDQPRTWFEWERRKISQPELKGLNQELPPQPAGSPWAADPVPDEPLINREEDGPTFNQEDANHA